MKNHCPKCGTLLSHDVTSMHSRLDWSAKPIKLHSYRCPKCLSVFTDKEILEQDKTSIKPITQLDFFADNFEEFLEKNKIVLQAVTEDDDWEATGSCIWDDYMTDKHFEYAVDQAEEVEYD